MGIKNLNNFLKKRIPHLDTRQPLSCLQGKRLAVDTNLYLYNLKSSHRSAWKTGLLKLVQCLQKYELKLVFVYDTIAPVEKNTKREERKQKRKDTIRRIKMLEKELDDYEQNHENQSEHLQYICQKYHMDVSESASKEIQSLRNQVVYVSSNEIQESKDYLQMLNIPTMDSPCEAETLCAYLCIHGYVDGVLSNDTDVLAYGTPLFVSRFQMKTETILCIRIEDILTTLNWTYEQFRDFCIMCGTDYNYNIHRVGMETSYYAINQHKSIDEIATHTKYDVSVLNHHRIRELFTADMIRSLHPTIDDEIEKVVSRLQ